MTKTPAASNASLPPDSSLHRHVLSCLETPPSADMFSAFSVASLLVLLPLSVLILRHGARQRRAASHGDVVTYHMAAMELLRTAGCALSSCGVSLDRKHLTLAGFLAMALAWCGEMCFHTLTCVERHLAAAHPVTYRSLRGGRGLRARNGALAAVWLLSAAGLLTWLRRVAVLVFNFVLVVTAACVVTFCSLSVLRVLRRPGPGQGGGGGGGGRRSRKRAFYTIVAILGALVMRFAVCLLWTVASLARSSSSCVVMTCGLWFSLPSGLVLPLLYIANKGKALCRSR